MAQVTKFENENVQTLAAEKRRQASNVVRLPRLPKNEAARLRQISHHRDECKDCVEMALVCLVGLAVLLCANALLRAVGLNSEFAHYVQTCLGFFAIAAGFTSLIACSLALVHFIQLRQL